MDKKKLQLGMNPSTASHRLVKDLLWHYVAKSEVCFHCSKEMTRETFSIEHKEPWLDSNDPVGLYFDLDNITFSHLACNAGAARQKQAPHGAKRRYNAGCRCEDCTGANRDFRRSQRAKGRR